MSQTLPGFRLLVKMKQKKNRLILLLLISSCTLLSFLGTRGAVLHHSAETVLCFRIHFLLCSSQSISSGEREPAYGVEREAIQKKNVYIFGLCPKKGGRE